MILEKIKYFLVLINEALPLSVAKDYSADWNKHRYDKAFGGKYRIYLPLDEDEPNVIPKTGNINIISKYLSLLGYDITDYIHGLAKKRDSDSKNLIKIGKLLTYDKLNALGTSPEMAKLILDRFLNDPARVGAKVKKEKLLAVISRHPYDIAGMSTDRGWTSCMNIETGSNKNYVKNEIDFGTIIAYLIKESDKNIKKPLGRKNCYQTFHEKLR